MTYKEAAERIKDHMVIHKMYEPRAVKITEALEIAVNLLLQAEQHELSNGGDIYRFANRGNNDDCMG